MTADSDNLLQPIEQPEEEKPKKPAKNFIKKNRETMGKKAAKNKENGNLVTLTQEQLNAILASVGKVASGREDTLRISMGRFYQQLQQIETTRRMSLHKSFTHVCSIGFTLKYY